MAAQSSQPATSSQNHDEFPYTVTLTIPFPTPRLCTAAHDALRVDKELSPDVSRHFSISPENPNDLIVDYAATTNRMLRVAVNGFCESLGVVIGVMRDLDTDVVEREMFGGEGLEGVQGLS
ncbi:Pcc1-domain-containing protein [Sporormia fimetaria CBS 119925]|uniref:Pcc1-domain-containing protein n=1 Tax=Sporormia fimetaria CBS 119925 TaxID=1340428 RepID=A0A6A6VDD1_9PLEO|nr:Pcc1-domain-containing protein [Sporormia fimetaria CBS 119925]